MFSVYLAPRFTGPIHSPWMRHGKTSFKVLYWYPQVPPRTPNSSKYPQEPPTPQSAASSAKWPQVHTTDLKSDSVSNCQYQTV